ncbi:MAG: ImmA/IrrE family metallo-endopeptidase [Clostridiales bacterium]|nr:ImmA/IrrE family metallo-endopeptidase [Candidatus Equinaster intestinalis]
MKTEALYKIAAKNNIKVDFFTLPQNKSVCVAVGQNEFIGLDNSGLTRADEKVCLAHELGHFQTGSLYNMYSPLDIREKHEKKADKWAIVKLVPKRKLLQAVKKGDSDLTTLAENFGVTKEFMQKAINYYNEN